MVKGDITKILENSFSSAKKEVERDGGIIFFRSFGKKQAEWITTIAEKTESLKAITTALATSLVKKIADPKQDIRLHKHELRGGYSARTLDTNYVTPFFKKNFRRFAMKESGWLTRSIEQPKPFGLKFPGKIRIIEVKKSFLEIINDVEKNKADSKRYLIALFILLIKKLKLDETKIEYSLPEKQVPILYVIEALKKHFFGKYGVSGASRLPVVALYSIYQILLRDLQRFEGMKLLDMESHISPDARSKCIGDIQVIDNQKNYFEAIEVKHGISIDSEMIDDAFQKFKILPVKRYYLLTTAEPNISLREEEKVKQKIQEIRNIHGCEVIANGLINSIKYYLRLIDNINEFLENYTKNLETEFLKTTEIKKEHIDAWKNILEEINLLSRRSSQKAIKLSHL